jgi:hypothetical protein
VFTAEAQRAQRYYFFHLPLSPAEGQRDASPGGETRLMTRRLNQKNQYAYKATIPEYKNQSV